MTAPEPPVAPGPARTGSLGTPGAGPGPGTAPPARPGAGVPAPATHRGRKAGLTLAAVLLTFVTVVLVLFVVFNTDSVDISLVFGTVHAPLVLALVIAAALGGLLVGLAGLVLRARRSRKS